MAIRGDQTPELIPSFPAWMFFFKSVDVFYANSALDEYVNENMGLAGFWKEHPMFRSDAVSLLLDYARWSTAELTKLSRDAGDLASIPACSIDPNTYHDKQMDIARREVAVLVLATDRVRDGLVRMDPDVGADCWNKIVQFVNQHVKSQITYSTDNTPGDLEVDVLWGSFNPKEIKKNPLHWSGNSKVPRR